MSNKYVSFVLFGLGTCIHLLAGASEIDSREKGLSSSCSSAVIGTNMEFAESALHKKIKKEKSKLEVYKSRLEESQSGQEVKIWLKKIKATEKTLKNLNEALFGLEIVKTRVGS